MKKKIVKYARKCDLTGKGMNAGWVINDGEEYASTEKGAKELLLKHGYTSLKKAFADDVCYWTDWGKDDFQYFVDDSGKLKEINPDF